MKNIFLVIMVFTLSFEVMAEDSDAKKNKCKNENPNAKLANINGSGESYTYEGSTDFGKCEKLSRKHFSKIYSSKNQARDPDFKWEPYISYACCMREDTDTSEDTCKQEKRALAQRCESVAYLISQYERDWENEEQISQQKSESVAVAATATTPSAMVASPIKCKSEGIETLDYDACKKFQEQLQLLDGVQQIAQGTQEMVYQNKMVDASAKHASDKNAATGALKATGESLKMQQDMYQQRTAIDSAKLTYLLNIYNSMPKSEDIAKKCDSIGSASQFSDLTMTPEICKSAARVSNGSRFALAINQDQLQTMKSKLITIATSAGSNVVLANLLGKRADDVSNAIAKIEAFKPIDPFVVSEEDATSTFCKMNPGLPQCLPGDLSRAFDTMGDNIITFGEGGSGTNYVKGNSVNDDGTISDSGSSGDTRGSVGPVGSIIAAAPRDNSMEESSAATVTTGGIAATAPGGGGGAASAGSGSGSLPTPANAGGVTAAVQGKTPSYTGGGSFSVMGGLGINKAKAKGSAEENPFGKLFGKDAPKGNGVVNFRDIASQKVGDKADNIFEMISKRYTIVNADKRLIEYELAK